MKNIIQNSPAFKNVSQNVIDSITDKATLCKIKAGQILFDRDANSDDGCYILKRGSLSVSLKTQSGEEQVVGSISPFELVGEMELLTQEHRAAKITALEECELINISRDDFNQIAQENPTLLSAIRDLITLRLNRNRLADLLPNFFGELTLQGLQTLEATLEWVHLSPDECLIKAGDPGEAFYILVNGRLQATVSDSKGEEKIVGEIVRGEGIGEMEIFTGDPNAASVYAIRKSTLVRFPKTQFNEMLDAHPKVSRNITNLVIRRLQRTMQNQPEGISGQDVVLIPVSDGVDLDEVARLIASGLPEGDSVLHIKPDTIEQALKIPTVSAISETDSNFIRLSTWLDEKEISYKYLFYQASPTDPAWLRTCIQRADRVLYVAHSTEEEPKSALLPFLLSGPDNIRRELVILHPATSMYPTNTQQWRDNLCNIHRQYHVRQGNNQDLQRVGRFLSGHALGMAMGGGGARGFAHIGVLRAMDELGVKVDLIGGTSFGSLIAAAHAIGVEWQTLYDIAKELSQSNDMLDYTIPIASAIKGKGFTQAIIDLFGDMQIENSWIEFFAVSSDLTQAQEMVHQSGPLWKSVRASCSLPGAFAPVVDGQRLLVDGVVVNNLPVDVAKRLVDGGPVIGVDVSSEEDLVGDYNFDPILSGWDLLRQRIVRRMGIKPKRPIESPLIFSTIMRVSELASVRLKNKMYAVADLMIRPEVESYGILQLSAFDKIVELGYQAAMKDLENWSPN